ncbi:MAG: sugar ABC transporter substrate-binding protein [Lachnospiraceae bacterium]|nr:sugar ABC transporter substrate-binding protein [Lachnospiraceae bacterium]
MTASLLAGCGSGTSGNSGDAANEPGEGKTDNVEAPAESEEEKTEEAAGEEATSPDGDKTEITVWSWDATVEAAIPEFEAANPDITVKFENVGSASDQYKAIDNALQAGTGFPDVAQFEYFAMPYFAVANKLADLSLLGAGDYASDYVDAVWNGVHFNNTLYALPLDYGQVVMFYNQDTFEKAGIAEAPTTWDEYYEAAKKIRALGDDYYISNAAGDIFLIMSLIWQAGGQPFSTDGNSVKVDFSDANTQKALSFWQKMIDEDLVTNAIGNWSDDWNRALNDGTLATQIIGGWMTANLPPRAPDASGNFRVAPMPQWNEGENYSAENGGSTLAILEASEKKEAAFKFVEYITHGDGVRPRVDSNATVPNISILESEEFLNLEDEYYGGQQVNQVIADAAANVRTGWQFPPFFEWMRNDWTDVSMPFFTNGEGDIFEVFANWQQNSIDYGNEQGFTVE